MYTITRTLPDGTAKTYTTPNGKMREVGKHVAYVLADNTNATRKEATQVGIQAESRARTRNTEPFTAHGYTFTIERA